MPVNTQHPDYIRLKGVWQQMRDVAEGQRAIHKAEETYLPRLDDESDTAYKARLLRASFFNATWRTIEGLRGMLFRVQPKREIAAAVEEMLKDVTKTSVDLVTFAKQVTREDLEVGRCGVLVDYPQTDVQGLTVAEVQAMNLRPHMALYKAENILNWSTSWINNRTVLSKVVLAESVQVPGNDEFEIAYEERWRVLDLVLVEGQHVYRVREYRKDSKNAEQLVRPPYLPLMNGKPMTFIPFQFFGVDDTTPNVELPPLLDLADVNLSHYRTTADRKHGAHKTAMPQPWANNITPVFNQTNGQPMPQKFYLGGGDLWTFPGATECGMLEYQGQGLGTLKEELEREEAQMAVLGARMLEAQKKGVEAAETAGIHRAGEQSVLATMADTISAGFVNVLTWFQAWAGAGDKPAVFELNKDFFPASMTPQELAEQVKAWQSGALRLEDLFQNLKAGGKVAEAVTFDEFEAGLQTQAPVMSQGVPAGDGD